MSSSSLRDMSMTNMNINSTNIPPTLPYDGPIYPPEQYNQIPINPYINPSPIDMPYDQRYYPQQQQQQQQPNRNWQPSVENKRLMNPINTINSINPNISNPMGVANMSGNMNMNLGNMGMNPYGNVHNPLQNN